MESQSAVSDISILHTLAGTGTGTLSSPLKPGPGAVGRDFPHRDLIYMYYIRIHLCICVCICMYICMITVYTKLRNLEEFCDFSHTLSSEKQNSKLMHATY